jgi:hypothetical protein
MNQYNSQLLPRFHTARPTTLKGVVLRVMPGFQLFYGQKNVKSVIALSS